MFFVLILSPVEQYGFLYFTDGAGDIDFSWACFNAVKHRPAAPNTVPLVEDFQPILRRLIAVIKDEAMGLHDGCWSKVVLICPE